MADLSSSQPARPLLDAASARPSRSLWWSRRAGLLAWQGGGLLLGALVLLVLKATLPGGEPTRIFLETLAWGWLAALGSAALLDALVSRQPYLHFTVALVSVVVSFGALFVWYVATHASYSRWAVAIAVAYTVVVQVAAWRHWRARNALRFGVVDADMLERLSPASRFPSDAAAAIVQCEWIYIGDDAPAPGVDGLVLPNTADAALRQRAALRAKLAGAQVYSESFVRALLTGRLDVDRAAEVFLDDVPTSVLYAAVKRLFDIVGTLALGVFALPVVLVCMLLVRIETPGSPLLVQPRVGLRGRVFGMCKLRTMTVARPTPGGSDDARITRIGRWLRRTRFDELPQLWNVLRGEMSLIGPRPEWIETAADLERRIPAFAFRYLVRPGITGWAQVHQGHVTGERDIRRKLEYDLYYAKNMSLALDLAITMLTIRTVLTGTGAK
jgi:lipopolysaccharide/colanic/teichoic acid biosynthesis glycosyltransferase